jgi:hypothetical protein
MSSGNVCAEVRLSILPYVGAGPEEPEFGL